MIPCFRVDEAVDDVGDDDDDDTALLPRSGHFKISKPGQQR